MRRSAIMVALLVLLSLLAACGGGGSDKPSASSGGSNGDLPSCPLDALASASKPVEITYWHAMTRVNEEQLKKLTSKFNASQSDVHVTISGVPSYTDNITRFKAGLGTGKLPQLIQSDDTSLQAMIDSRAVLPMQSCLNADHATTDDFVKRIAAYYTVKNVLWAMPFNDSNPVLYYDRALFTRAGLDPDKPPATLDELKADGQQIVQKHVAESGLALKADTVAFEHWLAKSGHTIVDNDNGRSGRATKVTFDDGSGAQLFAWIDDMTTSKLAISTSPSGVDHFLAVANGRVAMTIDSSGALGTIDSVLGSGQFKDVKLGVAPMPGPDSPEGGVLVGGAANYVVNKSSPAEQAAAYMFAKYLAEPQVQADWAAATGYVPVRTSSTKLAPLSTQWAKKPAYKVAYEQLLDGPENPATAGPVIGPYGATGAGVRGAITDALTRMLNENVSPADAIKDAATKANAAIADYNSRVG